MRKYIISILLLFCASVSAQTHNPARLPEGGTAPWKSVDSLKFIQSKGTLAPIWASAGVISTPVSISNGGTNAATAAGAYKNITVDSTAKTGQVIRVKAGGGYEYVALPASSGTYITEIPSGAENDTNVTFTISHTPVSDTTTDLVITKNGLVLNPFTHSGWSVHDYVISGTTLTFTVPPSSTGIILARYRY